MKQFSPDIYRLVLRTILTTAFLFLITIIAMVVVDRKEVTGLRDLRLQVRRQVFISDRYPIMEAEFVPMLNGVCTQRGKAIYTDSLFTCAALVIDDRKGNKHGLYHVTAADSKKEIEYFIVSNFGQNLNGINVYIQEGTYSNSIAVRNIYSVLSKIGLFGNMKFVLQKPVSSSSSILIKEGRLYVPSKRN